MPKFKKGNISDPFYETQIENLKSKLKISEESNDAIAKELKSLEIQNTQKDDKIQKLENELKKKVQLIKELGNEKNQLADKLESVQPSTRRQLRKNAIHQKGEMIELPTSGFPKNQQQRSMLTEALGKINFFQNLKNKSIELIVKHMKLTQKAKGEKIITQGSYGNSFYVLDSGQCTVTKDGKFLATIKPGHVFGELAILHECMRTATVEAATEVKCWELERAVYTTIRVTEEKERRKKLFKMLKKVDTFHDYSESTLGKIIDLVKEESFKMDDYIVRQYEIGNTFYIITEGIVDVTSRKDKSDPDDYYNRTLYAGDCFGDMALTNDSGLRSANIKCTSDVVKCLTLDKNTFKKYIGVLQVRNYEAKGNSTLFRPSQVGTKEKTSKSTPTKSNRLEVSDQRAKETHPVLPKKSFVKSTSGSGTLENIVKIKLLGKGGYGKVYLSHLKGNKEKTYALKQITKEFIVQNSKQTYIRNERDLLRDIDNSFIIKLLATFRDNKFVYLLTELCLGGELFTILRNEQQFSNTHARFYAGCVVEAFEYLHGHRIVHRDLKPENLLIDYKGYAKLVDFGFAKRIEVGDKTWTFCGTPEYTAPEISLYKGHDLSVDYWALGILIFEMLTGNPPFSSSREEHIYVLGQMGIEKIDWPRAINDRAKPLIRKLCHMNPSMRLGNLQNGLDDIRNHRWFEVSFSFNQ